VEEDLVEEDIDEVEVEVDDAFTDVREVLFEVELAFEEVVAAETSDNSESNINRMDKAPYRLLELYNILK
jgi:hypothetical protein